jgi:hypothetical protein
MGCILVAAFVASAWAAEASPRLVLVESHAPRAAERAFIVRLCAELRLLGVDVRVHRARSSDLEDELWMLTGTGTAACAATDGAPCAHDTAAAVRPEGLAATLLFVTAPMGRLSAYRLGGPEASDPTAWALQAAEVLRPELLDSRALTARRSDLPISTTPTVPPSQAGGSSTRPPTPKAMDSELPPSRQPERPRADLPARFFSELGFGVLVSRGMKPREPVLSFAGFSSASPTVLRRLSSAPGRASATLPHG